MNTTLPTSAGTDGTAEDDSTAASVRIDDMSAPSGASGESDAPAGGPAPYSYGTSAYAPVGPDSPTGPTGPTGPSGPIGPAGPFDGAPPPLPTPSSPSPASPPNRLRRSRSDRVGVGLAGGLGRYFGVDPVIFRVLFVVLALFGGSGIVLYLIGWLAVPDEDAANAPVDRVVDWLRRHSVPFWLVATVGLLAVWGIAFSWWMPFSIFPTVLVVLALLFLLSRRDRRVTDAPADTVTAEFAAPAPSDLPTLDPASVQIRSWYEQSKSARRVRRARSAPVRWATGVALLAALTGLVIADAIVGIPFGTYFWVVGGIVVLSLIVGLITRRTSWIYAVLLVPALVGVVSFGASSASAHDGFGDRHWTPASAAELPTDYRLGFGRSTLDLRGIESPETDTTIDVRQAAGQVRLLVPRDLPVRVEAHVHQGVVTVDTEDVDDGWNVDTTSSSPAAANATSVLTIKVHLTAGQILIDYRG